MVGPVWYDYDIVTWAVHQSVRKADPEAQIARGFLIGPKVGRRLEYRGEDAQHVNYALQPGYTFDLAYPRTARKFFSDPDASWYEPPS